MLALAVGVVVNFEKMLPRRGAGFASTWCAVRCSLFAVRAYCASFAFQMPLGHRWAEPQIRTEGSSTSKASMSPSTSGSGSSGMVPM